MSENFESIFKLKEIKKISDKVTVLKFYEDDAPDISFFTTDFTGAVTNQKYSNLELNKNYKVKYIQNGEYFNLVDANPSEEYIQGDNYKPATPDRDKRISRLAVLNTATEIVKIKRDLNDIKGDIESAIFDLAEMLEKWVYR